MLKAVLFDLDGTLYKGKTAIPGAEETLERLRKEGIRIFFITNAATRSRAGIVEKLTGMGIHAEENEVYGATYATARYITSNFPGKTVFCIGEKGMKDEFEKHKIKLVDDDSAEIIVVGLDRTIDYRKLSIGYRSIMKGAEFIATNTDATYPVEDGFLPGAGVMVAAIERCTGKKPFVVGKPESYFAELVIKENNLKKNEIIFVGDRLNTDIHFAKRAEIKSVMVLTGVSKKEDIKDIKPDFVIDTVNELPELLHKVL